LYEHAVAAVRGYYDRHLSETAALDLEHHFPDGKRFIAAWRTIRDEALAVGRRVDEVPRFHEIMPEQADISANDGRDWRMFILKAYGDENPKNMAACPELTKIVRQLPDVISASFSILGPRKHIPAHRGPLRGIIRFYLVLVMPRAVDGTPGATLRVDDTEYRLNEGEYLLWDDTFEHEAWNTTDQIRMVLSLDVRRQHMPLRLRFLSALLVQIVSLGVRLRGLR